MEPTPGTATSDDGRDLARSSTGSERDFAALTCSYVLTRGPACDGVACFWGPFDSSGRPERVRSFASRARSSTEKRSAAGLPMGSYARREPERALDTRRGRWARFSGRVTPRNATAIPGAPSSGATETDVLGRETPNKPPDRARGWLGGRFVNRANAHASAARRPLFKRRAAVAAAPLRSNLRWGRRPRRRCVTRHRTTGKRALRLHAR